MRRPDDFAGLRESGYLNICCKSHRLKSLRANIYQRRASRVQIGDEFAGAMTVQSNEP